MRLFKRDEGASLVEIALVVPLLVALAIGLAEVGLLVIDNITVSNAARSGARTGAAAADVATADDSILEVVEEDVCNLRYGDVIAVRIFEANSDGSMPPVAGPLVNSYIPNGNLNCNAAGHSFICDPTYSCTWGMADRDNVPPGFDAIGVEVEFSHNWVTNFIPFPTNNRTETVVMQFEPDTSVGG